MADAVVVDDLTKTFVLRHGRSIKEFTIRAWRRQKMSDSFTALDRVSLSVEQGEAVALMGLNGSGKSTLLKLMSGVMQPDRGSVRVRGRVAGLIEVGAGLHPDLTGRENVYLNAAILGMSRKETDRRFDEIVDFSEIERFLDTEVKFYSSGMFMRLGFSIAIHTDPDVFLVDEALAVGDVPFQKKCLRRIRKLHGEGRTLVIVSHDLATMQKICKRGAVLREGKLVFDGAIRQAVREVIGRSAEEPERRVARLRSLERPASAPAAVPASPAMSAPTASPGLSAQPAGSPARPPMYYLVGITGNPNYGDELIAMTWLRYLEAVRPDAEVWVDCPHPGAAAALLGQMHPNVRFTDTFWRVCEAVPTENPEGVTKYVTKVMADPDRLPGRAPGIELANRADLVHVMGGGYLNGVWPRNYGLLAAATATDARTVMTGAGMSPVDDDARSLVRDLVERFELADLRDAASAKALGVDATCDDAFLGLGPHLYRAPTDGDDLAPEFVMCLQSDLLDYPLSRLTSYVVRTMEKWKIDPENLAIVEAIPERDRQVFAKIERRLTGARFYTVTDVLRAGLPARPGQTWLTSRFHTHLVAAAAGAGGVALSVNADYYTNKHRSLIQQGSRWSLVEDLTVPERPAEGGLDEAALAELQSAKAAVAEKIYD